MSERDNNIEKLINQYMKKHIPDGIVELKLTFIKDKYNDGTYTIYPSYIIDNKSDMSNIEWKNKYTYVLYAEPIVERYQKKMTDDIEKLLGIRIRFSGRGFTMKDYWDQQNNN